VTEIRADGGFTLIEVLVALVIIGLFAGLISTIVRPDERTLLRVEAERLAQLLDLAGTEARMSGRSLAWTTDGASYRFLRSQRGAGWSEIRNNDLFRERTFPQGMKIAGMRIEMSPADDFMRLEFKPHGSMPAYAIKISFGKERYTVAGSPVGDVQALPGEGRPNDEII
jgi:general secretion pathway protein H